MSWGSCGLIEMLWAHNGIGHPGNKDAVTAYVLSRADAADEAAIRGSIAEAVDVLPAVLAGDLGAAMKKLHTVSDHGI